MQIPTTRVRPLNAHRILNLVPKAFPVEIRQMWDVSVLLTVGGGERLLWMVISGAACRRFFQQMQE